MVAGVEAQPPRPLDPLWTWQPPEGIDWIEPVAGAARPLVLVATGDARLHVLDAAQAPQRLPAFVQAHPGVRPVATGRWGSGAVPASTPATQPATPAQLVYCTDRLAAYALRPGPPIALQWQAGSWRSDLAEPPADEPTPEDLFQGDPEQLRRVVVASATEYGLALLRDDGRFGLLDRDNGQVRCGQQFPPTAAARLHVGGDRLALLRKDGANLAATFLEVPSGQRTDLRLSAKMAWPVWSELTAEGLLVAQPTDITRCTVDGERRIFEANDKGMILASTLSLHAGGLLVFGTSDGRLHALDVSAGRELWSVADHLDGNAGWDLLRADGDELFSSAGRMVTCRDLGSGAQQAQLSGLPGVRLVELYRRNQVLWLLWSVTVNGEERLLLERLGWAVMAGGPTFERRLFALNRTVQIRQTVWLGDLLLIATRGELHVYALR